MKSGKDAASEKGRKIERVLLPEKGRKMGRGVRRMEEGKRKSEKKEREEREWEVELYMWEIKRFFISKKIWGIEEEFFFLL